MFQSLKDRLFGLWEERFKYGIAVVLADATLNRFSNNELLLGVHLGIVMSPGTGHWPWHVFEVAVSTGGKAGWHLGVLGFTVGKVVVADYDMATQEIVGPDKNKYYSFFKGINHKNKQLEEII